MRVEYAGVMSESMQAPCTVCGEGVTEGQTFAYESQDDMRAERPAHHRCVRARGKMGAFVRFGDVPPDKEYVIVR